ncbi:MAG TPA: HesA/MoeB/ThiF family protein [Candidatus Azosocius sp. HAIN]
MKTNLFDRYKKQMLLSNFGIEGQNSLLKSKVLCVGVGGLGSIVLMYLVAAGVGTIGIVEMDFVELSNLHRQPIYNINNIGKKKIDSAYFFLNNLNSDVNIIKYYDKLSFYNVYEILKDFEIVIDCTDDFYSKFLINEFAFKLKIPMIYGASLGFEGQIAVFDSYFGCCLKCLYSNYPIFGFKNCNDDGVLGPIPGIIGCLQALETIKLILYKNNIGNFDILLNKILFINGLDLNIKLYKIKKNNNCNICSNLSEKISFFNKEDDFNYISYFFIKKNYNNIYFFDIRENYEYKKYHIFGSINVPFYIFYLFIPFLFKKLSYYIKIIICCNSGMKSSLIYKLCKKYSYFNLYFLKL